jgi:hypothetical protein
VERLSEPSLNDLLREPIVRQLMARDGASERQVRAIALWVRRRLEHQRRRAGVDCTLAFLQVPAPLKDGERPL